MRRLVLLTLAVGCLGAGCGQIDRHPALRVGALYPSTGSQGGGGSEEARGVRLAAEWVNGHGGAHGRPIELVSLDAPRAEAVPRAFATFKDQGISVVVGSHGSAISAAAATAATREDMSFWETGAVGEVPPEADGGRHFFRLAPMGANLGRAAIAFARDQLAARLGGDRPLRYAAAWVDDAYGRSVAAGALSEAAESGQPVVGRFAYPSDTVDWTALARRIGEARPDVLFVAAYLDDGVALRRALVSEHVPLLASIGTSSSYCMPAFGDRLGDAAVGLFASDKPDAADVNPAALTTGGRRSLAWVKQRYERRYREPMSAPALSGFSNAYVLFAHVLPSARSLSVADVARAAMRTKLPEGDLANGGGLDIAPPDSPDAGANRRSAGVIWEWVAPRTRAVVWPPAFATHAVQPLALQR